ncbi:cyclic AMP-dependent transcription factor ATF-3-like isoform X2 [Ruditapes philippinarum]|uniref:cyclic AMP-dependent transcription factor ATF-3-like isoform X2 n=1 Tax=Ruditapes philippinarum TaxID=129788 RepID=UPI00295B5316|nr:cyclic AMP-dependent transcription factor ATF-3-like isoform X2 [Ruditapes philippinarum]
MGHFEKMDSNLGSYDLDPSVKLAYEASKNSQSIMPILKEELKLTILNRRCKEGKGEINFDEKKPVIKRELTEDEVKKKLRRKEQNRRAAERCRVKKKYLNEQLAIDYINEQKKTNILSAEIEQLRKEKERLQRVLRDHAFTCARAVTPSPSYEDTTTFFSNGPYTCPTPGIPNENPYPQRDTATPMEDPFDEYAPAIQDQDFLMYPGLPDMLLPQNIKTFPTCTAPAEELPEIQLPDDFPDFQPISPDVALGRQSISEFCFDEESLKIL